MTRENSWPPDEDLSVRVLARAPARQVTDETAWTAFSGEVRPMGSEGPIAVGARVAGFGPPGDEIRVPVWSITPLPDGLTDRQGAMLPLACVAVRAARLASPRAGGRAQVIGDGPLAALVAQALRAAGAADVAVSATPSPELAPVVVETTGDVALVLALLEAVPRLARVVLAGSGRGRRIDVDFYRTVHHRGLEVVGVHDFGPLSDVAGADDRRVDVTNALALVVAAPPA
jgi:threonine dehydrogenase-like Zn-dependent dehydrogenase